MPHYKMGIYGEPAVGKSVFSLGWPKPFFICTDENYEYLLPFGAKEENHVQVTSWQEFKDCIKNTDFSKYETIVIDLIEDLYQWADAEYCRRNKIDDLSDVGYGKAYKIVRNDFIYYILKVLNQKANVILLSHEETSQDKNSRGVEFTSYSPSSYIPKKCWEMINGKLRFFFRAHIEEVQEGDSLVKKRLLSIRPKAHEFQINRGLDVDSLPDDIDLKYQAFANLFGEPSNKGEIEIKRAENVKSAEESEVKIVLPKVETPVEKPKIEPVIKTESKVEPTEVKAEAAPVEKVTEVKLAAEPKATKINDGKESTQERINAIKAKLAQLRAQNN